MRGALSPLPLAAFMAEGLGIRTNLRLPFTLDHQESLQNSALITLFRRSLRDSQQYIQYYQPRLCNRINNGTSEEKSRDSSFGIALGYGLNDRSYRVRFPAGAGNFSLHHRVQNGSAPPHPPIQRVLGALSLGVKRPGTEADHSLPSSAQVKNAWSYTSTPSIRLHVVVLG
jgi:hypothetical protein